MSVVISTSGTVATISLSGDFDFSRQEKLQQAFEQTLTGQPAQIDIDLTDTTFIDSSVIRLLLRLRDQALLNQTSLAIINCSDRIREIFTIGGFDQIFKIS